MNPGPIFAVRTGLLATLVRLLGVAAVLCMLASIAGAQNACPPACSGQTLDTPNFLQQDLTNANFEGATIKGGMFVRANLTGANFKNATFMSVPGRPLQTPDFTFANLTHANFSGARFNAPTYFTYANLTCADFSQTDISTGNAVFGDEPLIYTAPAGKNDCRTLFRNTTMNCEFIDDWRAFDLTGAVVTACATKLARRNFANAIMTNVSFESAILDGATFTSAVLNGANFNNSSLQCAGSQCVNLSNAQLQGAKLNKANLTGANLQGAILAQDATGKNPASLSQAHLKNVNLADAQLSGVDFTNVNFYGDQPANSGGCKTKGGFTLGCASAHSAQMTDTQFEGAYLYGVDFQNATMLAVNFHNAVLVGANFGSATIGQNPSTNLPTNFNGAHLQGTNLKDATFSNVDFSNAFFDFRNQGNSIFINLNGLLHNSFACSTPSTCKPATGADVCVSLDYSTTTVAPGDTRVTCPDGTTGSCGTANATPPLNPHWNSPWTIGKPPPGPPPGWYLYNATYTPKASEKDICNGEAVNYFW